MTTPFKVVHVSSAHPWTDNRIHLREAASLARAGYQVTLVACEKPGVSVPPTGVDISLIPSRRRLRRWLISTPQAALRALRTKADVVHLHDPELAWTIPLFRLMNRRVIFDAHEDMPQQLLAKTYLPQRARRALQGPILLYLRWLAASDHIIAATETIAGRFRPDKVTVVFNYPTTRSQNGSYRPVGDRPERLAYLGLLTRERGVETMLESIEQPEFPSSWRLDLAGQFYPTSYSSTIEERPGRSRVEYHGVLPPQAARDILLNCRVGLAVLHDTPNYRDSMPTKMFEYFAAGLPVIASDFPLWRTIVLQNDCGILVDPESPLELACAIQKYATNPALLERHSENAVQAFRTRYNWDTQASALLAVYQSLNIRARRRWRPW